jgi:hypothetical protein
VDFQAQEISYGGIDSRCVNQAKWSCVSARLVDSAFGRIATGIGGVSSGPGDDVWCEGDMFFRSSFSDLPLATSSEDNSRFIAGSRIEDTSDSIAGYLVRM